MSAVRIFSDLLELALLDAAPSACTPSAPVLVRNGILCLATIQERPSTTAPPKDFAPNPEGFQRWNELSRRMLSNRLSNREYSNLLKWHWRKGSGVVQMSKSVEHLKSILKTHGRLSTALLRLNGLSAGSLCHRFGSLINPYDLIGYETRHKKTGEHRLYIRKVRSALMQQIVDMFPGKVSLLS